MSITDMENCAERVLTAFCWWRPDRPGYHPTTVIAAAGTTHQTNPRLLEIIYGDVR